jgi:hypothetical protein
MAGFLDKLMALLGLRAETPAPGPGKRPPPPDDAHPRTARPDPPSAARPEPPSPPDAAPAEGRELPDDLRQVVAQLLSEADELFAKEQWFEAAELYCAAMVMIPEPLTDWKASAGVLTSAGDAFFRAGMPKLTVETLSDAVRCPGGLGNPFIHLRLGQAQLLMGDQARGVDNLARAYLQEGVKIFADEDPRYLAYIKLKLKRPPGGWPAGW